LLAVNATSSAQGNKSKEKKQIAITFDELPAARSFGEIDREAITYLLLTGLKKYDVKVIGFVVGDQIEDGYDLLGRWLNDGHKLGNLTFSGQDYNRLGPEQFIRDIRKGDEALEGMLSGFGQKERYFRYPYHHYGDTREKRKQAKLFLEAQGYTVCPATVIPEDYLYNLQLTKLGKEPDSAKYEALMNEYVNHVLDEVERQEMLARDLMNRNIRQILLLRTNRLNAVFLEDLLGALKDMGYEFVTIDTALKDEVYQIPEAYYGMKGVGYVEMILQSNPDLIPAR
jgi:peptidoglycan/xylan/chitin deacetylase (PgdA/CDA1 family)